ncbi:FAD-dependent oxidoreductase [Chloroflexota bacterium]
MKLPKHSVVEKLKNHYPKLMNTNNTMADSDSIVVAGLDKGPQSEVGFQEVLNMNKSVLVIGSDKASKQAAMNLANSGFQVFFVPRCIKAMMNQMDKTFLTKDCAACVLAPKIIQGYREGRIKVLNDSDVAELRAYLGSDTIPGRCPVVTQNKENESKIIFKPSVQAVPNLYFLDSKATPPCKAACPIGLDVQGYIALITQSKFKEALSLIRQKNPLPGVTSRVCTHPCEVECNRKDVDKPIAIPTLRRFVVDHELTKGGEVIPLPITESERIAIIGSGPSGLTVAHDLRNMGYGVTIFEALPIAGGMLTLGIPEYRLPKKVLQDEIKIIQNLGVEIKLNSPVGKDGFSVDDLKKQGYQAIFIAVGAHHSLKLAIPGEELEGVYQGVPFLKDVSLGRKVIVGEKVAIIGGGNVAIDAARTALRLGAKEVFIVYRRSRQEMPAFKEEIEAAEQEGVIIHYLAAPVRILGKGEKVVGVECIRTELGKVDDSGRRHPAPVNKSEFVIDVDMVIPSIGEVPDLSFLPDDSKLDITQGKIKVDPKNLTTSLAGIFAGGDVVTGPGTVIEAMAAGKKAAVAIDGYLKKRNLPFEEELLPVVTINDIDLTNVIKKSRVMTPSTPILERISNFNEVNIGFSQEMAIEEANRCLACKREMSAQECYVLYCGVESSV